MQKNSLYQKIIRSQLITTTGLLLILIALAVMGWVTLNQYIGFSKSASKVESTILDTRLTLQKSLAQLRNAIATNETHSLIKEEIERRKQVIAKIKNLEVILSQNQAVKKTDIIQLKLILSQLFIWQERIADIATAPGNQPLVYLLKKMGLPIHKNISELLANLNQRKSTRKTKILFLQKHFNNCIDQLSLFLITKNDRYLTMSENELALLKTKINEINAEKSDTPEIKDITETLATNTKAFSIFLSKIKKNKKTNKLNQAQLWLKTYATPLAQKSENLLTQINNAALISINQKEDRLLKTYYSLFFLFFLIALIIFLFSFYLTKENIKKILSPIIVLQKATEKIMRNELKEDLPITSKDEISALTYSFNNMRRNLQSTNENLRYFMSAASHELKSPTHAINSLATFILEDNATLPSKDTERLKEIQHRTQSIENTINSMHSYFSTMTKTHTKKTVLIDEIFSDISNELKIESQFELTYLNLPKQLQTYESLLKTVFYTLIDNAIKHHDQPHGKILISAEKKENHYLFCVQDDGPGIKEANPEKLFDLFKTRSPTSKQTSSGIGLTLAKSIVVRLGGRIWFDSNYKNGTRICFNWPL